MKNIEERHLKQKMVQLIMKWLSKKTLLPLLLAGIFLSSVLVVFSSGGLQKKQAVIIVDMGQGQVYQGKIQINEKTTALTALSSFAYSVEIENGKVYCIANYCNTNVSVWKFYKLEQTSLGSVEKEVNQSIENYKVEEGEILVFRYESI